MGILILIVVGLAGIGLGYYFRKKTSRVNPRGVAEMAEMRAKGHKALSERTEGRKEKILYILRNVAVSREEFIACGIEDIKKGITSGNVAKLLDVSSDTARKYLNELEDENQITQVGKQGPNVYYTLK